MVFFFEDIYLSSKSKTNTDSNSGEYTINIRFPSSWGETEVLKHHVKTTKTRDTSLKDAIYARISEIETRAFNSEQALKWINSTVQAHNLLFKNGKLKSDLFPSEKKFKTSQGTRINNILYEFNM